MTVPLWKDLDKVIEAANSSSSIREFLQKLELPANTGNYRRAKQIAANANVPLPKFNPSTNSVRLTKLHKIPDAEFFSRSNTLRGGKDLRQRLIRDQGVLYECSICGISEWNSKSLVLQVDHVDGDRFNNKLSNLRLLCPNCHSQTETFGNKNKDSNRSKYSICSCGKRKLPESTHCYECYRAKYSGAPLKIEWPSSEDVIKLVRDTNFKKAGEMLGVSDNAVRKFLMRNGFNVSTIKT